MIEKLAVYFGAGIGLGVLVQSGFPVPGIMPISAPGFWLNVGLWPVELIAGWLGAPVYLAWAPVPQSTTVSKSAVAVVLPGIVPIPPVSALLPLVSQLPIPNPQAQPQAGA